MMEHFGLDRKDVSDPFASREIIQQVSSNNTKVYFEIFHCEPDNTIRNFSQLAEVRAQRESTSLVDLTEKYLARKDEIKGHAVEYPAYFLHEERLGQSILNQEILVPEIAFV